LAFFPLRTVAALLGLRVWQVVGMLQNVPCQFDARTDVEFAEDLPQVVRHGVDADEQLIGDAPVGEPLGDEAGDPLLGSGQAAPAVRGPFAVVPVPPAFPDPPQALPDAGGVDRKSVV